MSYFGQYPFNTNGGALLSKRNYINRKLDDIEQRLINLGWIEPEVEEEEYEQTNEYDMPIESAGALIPYRDKVNKRLDFFEEVIRTHTTPQNNYYDNQQREYVPTQPKIRYDQPTPKQEEFKESFTSRVNDLFG